MWLSGAVRAGFLPVEATATTLPFGKIVMAGHMHSWGCLGNIGQKLLSTCVQPQECVIGGGVPLKLGQVL